VPILPLIDLLILAGTVSLGVGFVLKSVAITTIYHPMVFGFSSIDFVVIAGVCFGLAVVLSARTWVKLNEPRLLGLERARRRLEREGLAEGDRDSGWAPAGNGHGNGNGQRAPAEAAPVEAAPAALPEARGR